jgi:hypothetical protein
MEASVLFQNMRILIYRRENRVEKRGGKKIKSNRVYFIHGMLYKFIIIHMRIVNGLISFMVWINFFYGRVDACFLSIHLACRILANIQL